MIYNNSDLIVVRAASKSCKEAKYYTAQDFCPFHQGDIGRECVLLGRSCHYGEGADIPLPKFCPMVKDSVVIELKKFTPNSVEDPKILR